MSERAEGPYRIATVAELTGVPEPTLRAWERRYGLPTPDRTESGYRLYGPGHVRQVLEMKRLCEGGVAAAEAAKLVLERGEADPPATAALDSNAALVDAIVDAVKRFDDAGLDQLLRRVLLLGSAETILDRVLAPALVTIGERWHEGEIGVAQEHLASQKIGALLRDLVRLAPGTDAVFASFAEDEHDIGLLGFALRVADWGTRPVFLGARTPPSAVRNAVEALSPRLVALSLSITPPRPRARELIEDYAAACGSVPWVVGGAGAGPLAQLIETSGGLLAPHDLDELRSLVQPLLATRGARRPKEAR
jgi:DNA-binding transcriptional MerR regulator